MLRELIEEKFLDKEIEIYLNGHIFFFPGNPTYFDGVRESSEWELNSRMTNSTTDKDGSWSKFRTIKSKIVKVVEIIHEVDYEMDEWKLRCIGKKGKEYLISVPE